MCHLILLMPVLALPIFWLMPLNLAIPIYVVIGLITSFLYRLIAKSMGSWPAIGAESLVGGEAEVVSKLNAEAHAQYLVRAGGELWSAFSPEPLQPGETVRITTLDGVRLTVERGGGNSVTRGRRNRC